MFEDSFSEMHVYPVRMLLAVGTLVILSIIASVL
jgi:hypothetical protein